MGIPEPPTVLRTASQLLAHVHLRRGRTYRFLDPPKVICLTDDEDLAVWLGERGASAHVSRMTKHSYETGLPEGPTSLRQWGGYRRAHDSTKLEWDFNIHTIPVSGEQTIWEAAAR